MSIFEELEKNLPRMEVPFPNLFQYFLDAAEDGIAYAQWKVGNCYYSGRFVEQSFFEARRWYGRAAAQGFYLGERDFAFMLKNGLGGAVDLTAAAFYFENAASACGLAAVEAGRAYLLGMGVRSDRKRARSLFVKAGEKGENFGHEMVAYMDAFEGIPLASTGERAEMLIKASNSGNLNALYALAMFYYRGGYGKQPRKNAYEYFKEAASKGHLGARLYLAKCELAGFGCEVDVKSAMQRLDELISEHNCKEAYYTKGAIYLVGQDVPQDLVAAQHWMEPAAKAGHLAAMHGIAICLKDLNPTSYQLFDHVSELFEKAFEGGFGSGKAELSLMFKNSDDLFSLNHPRYYQAVLAAASQGCADSMFMMGMHHLHGAQEKNSVSGVFWLASAIDEGHTEAFHELAVYVEREKDQTIVARNLQLWGSIYGNAHSTIWLAKHFDHLPGANRGIVARYYLISCRLGDLEAPGRLSQLFATGDGVPVDHDISEMLYDVYMENMNLQSDGITETKTIKVTKKVTKEQSQVSQPAKSGIISFPAPKASSTSEGGISGLSASSGDEDQVSHPIVQSDSRNLLSISAVTPASSEADAGDGNDSVVSEVSPLPKG